MSETKYQAAKYIRLSYADDKDGESNSVENQRKQIDSFIATQPDIEAVSEKVDDGVSGIIFDRKAFKEMMEEIEAGEINCVIVKDLSRFGREYIETGRYLRRILPSYGVRFIAINDNIDTLRDNADDLVVGVKSIINDAYSRDISVKTRSALNVKRDNGDYVGACPIYGYRRSEENKNQLAIDEYPASIVRDIFRMKIDGMSASKIAETLNRRGVLSPMAYKRDRGLPHPTGGFADKPDVKWSATAIFRILNDETYTGMLVQGRRGTFNYKIKDVVDKPEAEWKRTEDAHEAIISKQDFDLAHRIMKLDTRTAPGGDKVYLFSGVLICGCCGGRMTRKTNRYKGREYHYYYCPCGKKNGCTAAAMVREDDLIACTLESVKGHISCIASLETVLSVSDNRRAAQALAKQLQTQIDDNERQLTKIGGFKASLYENMVSGVLTKDEYKSLKTKYVEDEAHLRDAIAALEEERDNALDGRAERLRWMEHFNKFEGLEELDRRTVVNLIQSIRIISKTELQVTFNYQLEYEQALSLLDGVSAKSSDFVGRGRATERSECPAQDGRNKAESTRTKEVA
jgi:site-specific DNA recombinase